MQKLGKPEGAYNELEGLHHQSFVYLFHHQSQNLHSTVVSQPTAQRVSLVHVYTKYLNGIWRQQQRQQQGA